MFKHFLKEHLMRKQNIRRKRKALPHWNADFEASPRKRQRELLHDFEEMSQSVTQLTNEDVWAYKALPNATDSTVNARIVLQVNKYNYQDPVLTFVVNSTSRSRIFLVTDDKKMWKFFPKARTL